MKIVVVGTSHAGFEAVQTILKDSPETEVHLYERGDTASFLSCGIHSYLKKISPSLDSLHYANEVSYKDQGIHIHMQSDVTGVNPAEKTIQVTTPDGEHTESYDKLFLSPGAVPVVLPIPGLDSDDVFYMRGRNWADKIKARMTTAKKAVVVGGGYIGIEVAEAFTLQGIDTTLVDFMDTILPTYLDKEFTDRLIDNAQEHGLHFHGGEKVQEVVTDNGRVQKVITDKHEYECDTVVMAVGVCPNTGWLKDTLKMNEKGFIEVDEYLQSSEPNIYVAGDATFVPFAPNHGKRPIALATNARRQAVIAAKNMLHGNSLKMVEVSGTSGLALFDYHFACTGVKDVDANVIRTEVASTYYEEQILPDFMQNPVKIYMKIHYEKDSHRIVGGQLMSKDKSVILSINTLSLAISAGWTLEQLALADFFFQPEYNRPWSFLNVLAQQALGPAYTFGSDQEIF